MNSKYEICAAKKRRALHYEPWKYDNDTKIFIRNYERSEFVQENFVYGGKL